MRCTILIVVVVYLAFHLAGTKIVITKKWAGLVNKNRAVAVFQDRPGIVSVGYFSNIKKWNCYPYAVSIDRRGVYLQVPRKRGIPRVKSLRWDKHRLRIE